MALFSTCCSVFFFWLLRSKLQPKGKKEMRTTYIALLAFYQKVIIFVTNSKLWPFYFFFLLLSFRFGNDSLGNINTFSVNVCCMMNRWIWPMLNKSCNRTPFWHCHVVEYFMWGFWKVVLIKNDINCYSDAIERKGRAKVLCSSTYVDPFR